jgi:hypothetical protein
MEFICMSGHTSLKCLHNVCSPLGNAVTAVEEHLGIVSSVVVPQGDSGSVEACVAMETFISTQFTQHTTRPMLAGYIFKVAKDV